MVPLLCKGVEYHVVVRGVIVGGGGAPRENSVGVDIYPITPSHPKIPRTAFATL
jgi:hypothetical protein